MEFRRIGGLPPYVFAQINGLKAEARSAGRDVIDFGFGNPDLPSPAVAVEKLAEAAHNPRNHRYSASRGIPNLRLAMTNRYKMGQPLETQPCVFIDPSKTFQTFIGIGGALTDAAAETYARLPRDKQQEIMQAYFDPVKGIGYTLARTNI